MKAISSANRVHIPLDHVHDIRRDTYIDSQLLWKLQPQVSLQQSALTLLEVGMEVTHSQTHRRGRRKVNRNHHEHLLWADHVLDRLGSCRADSFAWAPPDMYISLHRSAVYWKKAHLEIAASKDALIEDKGLSNEARFRKLHIRIPAYAQLAFRLLLPNSCQVAKIF